MQINDITIDADVSEILTALREQLAEQGIMRFEKIVDSGEDVMVQCPYHKDGQERRPSAGIRKSDGLLHCLACGETHSLPEVVGFCFGRDMFFGYNWLMKNFGALSEQDRQPITLNLSRTPSASVQEYVSEDELDSYRYTHPYMYERGLTDEVIEMFDIGYDKSTDSITFPVRDIKGNTLFVARRTIKYKSFNIPKNVDKPLYGDYELSQILQTKEGIDKFKEVYVCEGLFDCLRLWCVGKYAVAGFGCLFSDKQIKDLCELPTRKIIFALDNDQAGISATERLKRLVRGKLMTTAILPYNRKDIGECTDDELKNLRETLY